MTSPAAPTDLATGATGPAPAPDSPAGTSGSPAVATGIGLLTRTPAGTVLDVWFPEPRLGGADADADARVREALAPLAGPDGDRGVEREVVEVGADLAAAPTSTADVYLRLHLLSHRLVRPHGVDLTGVFGLLSTVVWTGSGPCAVEGFEATRLRLLAAGRDARVVSVDKFPRMLDYVVPAGVRVGDGDRVRLGAHLAPGTTVMHEGFVNYNAGTLGTAMVEGRVSAGVVVGDGSDVGGGASIMGTLSGGGIEVVSIGRRSLLGANAGLGIALGDDCVVESGLYLTAGTKVTLPDGRLVKARELSGVSGLTFRRNSVSGTVEAVVTASAGAVTLNEVLHANG